MFKEFWNKAIREINTRYNNRKIFLGIGVFDGVHLGHKKIFEELKKMSSKSNGVNIAVTFSPHPRAILANSKNISLLIGLEERINFLKMAGADEVLVVNFNSEFANLTADEFLEIIYNESMGLLGGICVGKNWHFGAGGSGNSLMLGEFCKNHGLEFCGVEELKIDGEIVSSSNIRVAISSGLFAKANHLLGRNYRLRGIVEHGYAFASSKLSKPTANLKINNGILMVDGVYAAKSYIGDKVYKSAVNIGFAPSFSYAKVERRIEVHLLDFEGDIYGQKLEVEVVKYLRAERCFSSIDELRKQIEIDIKEINNILK